MNNESTVVSFLTGKLTQAERALDGAQFETERIDEGSLAVGYRGEYFCNLLAHEDDNVLGIGFDLQTNPQVAADVALVVAKAVGATFVEMLEPHYLSLDGEVYFGEEAYDAFYKDKERT